jgi:hypothetical protein
LKQFFPTIVLFGLLGAGAAQATSVTLVRPTGTSEEVTETLSRLRGELHSLGLEPLMVNPPPSDPNEEVPPRWLQDLKTHGGSGAVIDIVAGDVVAAVDVWILKGPDGTWQLVRIGPDPKASNQPESLALRAVEALRAGLLIIDAKPKAPDQAVAVPTVAIKAPASDRFAQRLGLEIGAVALMSLDGVGPAVLPLVRFDWLPRPWLVLQATWAGPGSMPTVALGPDQARVSQQFGLLGACYRPRAHGRVWPLLGLAAGVLRSSIEGRPGPRAEGATSTPWSLLFDASLGAGLRLSPRFHLSLAAHVQLAKPYLAIHLADRVAATTGRPNLLFILTLGAWL